MIKTELIIALLTMIATLASFYLAIRSAIKNNSNLISEEILANERRHSKHEKHIALLREKIDNLQNNLLNRINELNKII